MTFFAGNILYASDLNGLIPRQIEGVCNVATTVTTSLADVTGATATFTTVNANAIGYISWTIDNQITVASAGVTVIGQMNYDGVDVNTRQALVSLDDVHRITVGQTDTITFASAGSHTVTLRCQKTGAGGTDQLQTNHTQFSLLLYDIPA